MTMLDIRRNDINNAFFIRELSITEQDVYQKRTLHGRQTAGSPLINIRYIDK